VIEAMKMRRQIHSPLEGVVRTILAREGEIVDINHVLMVVS
jgi:biotin carboxyl carrier protein